MTVTNSQTGRAGAIAVGICLLVVSVATSHDVWLMPERFVLMRGDTLVVRQLVGSEFEIHQELELLRVLTPTFRLYTPTDSIDLLSELPDFRSQPVVKPVLKRKLDFDGLALVEMSHAFIHTEFSSQRFNEYLEHESISPVELGFDPQSEKVQTERYARSLKSLVRVGEDSKGDLHQKIVGQTLEVLLQQNPYDLAVGEQLEVLVLFRSKPLVDHGVTVLIQGESGDVSMRKTQTDELGIARFKKDRPGYWLIRLVHLIPSDDPGVDWDSYWTSYSFSV